MKILVIDGQGGGIGRAIVERASKVLPEATLIALGTNALATAAMLRAGAHQGATGENAIRAQCRTADVIAGPIGIVLANALLGEVSAEIARAVADSPAQKLLIPSERCNIHVAGTRRQTLDEAIAEILDIMREMIQ
ncbi:DUF3842 family protein [Bacillota bacterium Meth-B3]|nr:DUF3842 family protein [Christensenellaceae bacterium]MEA5065390.1 DUF3842 family protein [Eubacteriales bacterium]MEA5069333.1 DUF3842 family protein [Christensenellaceae bacterium]